MLRNWRESRPTSLTMRTEVLFPGSPVGLPVVGLLAIIVCSGCPTQPRQTPAVSSSESAVQSPITAEELWNRTRAAYRTAAAYRDKATIRLTYLEGTQPRESTAALALP